MDNNKRDNNPNFVKEAVVSGTVTTKVFIITALTFVVAMAWNNVFEGLFGNTGAGAWVYAAILTISVVILTIILDIGIKKIKKTKP